jgi:hypothetical protein
MNVRASAARRGARIVQRFERWKSVDSAPQIVRELERGVMAGTLSIAQAAAILDVAEILGLDA